MTAQPIHQPEPGNFTTLDFEHSLPAHLKAEKDAVILQIRRVNDLTLALAFAVELLSKLHSHGDIYENVAKVLSALQRRRDFESERLSTLLTEPED